MLEPYTSPVPEPESQQNGVQYREDNDIELPACTDSRSHGAGSKQASGKLVTLLGIAVVTAFIAFSNLGFLHGKADESDHPNWRHVEAATSASPEGSSHFVRIASGNRFKVIRQVEVTAADADKLTTQQIRAALMRNDTATATSVLQGAQRIPAAAEADVQLPTFSADGELAGALKDGHKELFQIELFDCCQEDGDVVDVLVNGSHFSTVPITNAGTLLSIPLSSGNNTITVRGSRDGRGGVTLSLRTSRGEFFARRMHVGEAYEMEVLVQ